MKNKIALAVALLSTSASALAGLNSSILITAPVPAVSQAGLIAMAFALGLMGAHLIRKRKSQ